MNDIYNIARYRFANAQLNWTAVPLRMLAFSGTLDFDPTDDAVSDITARGLSALVMESQVVNHQSVSLEGYLQSDAIVIPSVPVGAEITSFVMILKTADVPSSIPLLFFDTALNLPFIPNGLDMVVQPDWFDQRGWARV